MALVQISESLQQQLASATAMLPPKVRKGKIQKRTNWPIRREQQDIEGRSMLAAKRRVLIVEDDPLIASAVAMIVETELAYESITAHSIARAAELIDARTSLGFLDVEVEDGLTFPLALQLLRRGNSFVFLSGRGAAQSPPPIRPTPFFLET